jgi:hypothetical protein
MVPNMIAVAIHQPTIREKRVVSFTTANKIEFFKMFLIQLYGRASLLICVVLHDARRYRTGCYSLSREMFLSRQKSHAEK